ncbi:bifunctional copper resistance protein CopD/cytochrome c oxidase assembly protein [Leucobacter insecticola]|uniref:Bifunctional copper resistance protein CopD/cytochrome c oxidase assembly protein n=1 Tax=Leucobacter insecticola TaxID=2714934 RepID=A0A6G8FH94_9MICO|nr:cytochrome c oxidase assembly protein [Leucobacter insecticola]QIM15653.1 bifunctional copper resistance protein CopD/cytochrome c oxidase assembly protein [Leucobacter insecticola]
MPRFLRVVAPAVLVAVTLAALIVGLGIGGAAAERTLLDPGTVVRFGIPISRTLVNVAMAGLIGSLVMAVWVFASDKPESRIALDIAAGSAAVLAVASAATLLFTYVDISGQPFSGDARFGAGLAQFVTEIELGRLWLIELLLAAVTTVLAFAVRDRRLTLLVLFAAMATTIPLAQQGHAAGASGHAQAVNSLLVHLIGASVWLGGLVTLVFVAKLVDRKRLAVITARYSTLALFAFIGVAASGAVSAWLRVGDLDALLGTGYGRLVILKTAALVALGIFGAVQRTRLIPRISDSVKGGRVFAWFVIAELAVMGVASGIAGALGRTATPVALEPARDQASGISPAEWLTGDPLPPELTPLSYVTGWKFDLAWLLVCVFGLAMYVAAVIRLAHRGDKWPIARSIAWVFGLLMLFYTTNGPFNLYEQYLFSVHMLGHMMLTMVIPIALVLGAPITLLLRATEKRNDGSWGGREWVLWLVQTPYSKFITHPAVAAVVFVGSLWVFYFSPIFRWAMSEHLGHQWMIIHFLIGGYLFALSMIGIDPVPYRFPFPLRLITLFATMASHAFFGVTMMTGDSLMLADWFGAMGRTWGATPLEDQTLGGGIAWGIGELPTLALALIVAVQWSRNDTKVQKRKDRAADRSGEAELMAYNEMLEKQAARDRRTAEKTHSG